MQHHLTDSEDRPKAVLASMNKGATPDASVTVGLFVDPPTASATTAAMSCEMASSIRVEWESHSRQRSERLEKLQGTRDLPSTPRRRDREALAPRDPTPAARPMSR